ncbi:MAG: hypothetical protein UU09_C0018G0007 [Microgenomates group bacterium GW2011_GWA2_40_6]|nr:MAG: hypothetical protein UU09_C0018G0007 [Microgenomates group bacterium GW2011_GWA2_40_6]
MTKNNNDWKSYCVKLEDFLNLYFGQKAPALPDNIKEFIVKYGPYISLVLMVLSLPAILLVFGITGITAPFSLGVLLSLAAAVLVVMALPGLFKRRLSAWRLMYYSSLVSALQALLAVNLGGLIIGAALSFYCLFQIRSLYK